MVNLVGTLAEGLDHAFVLAAFRSRGATRRARAEAAIERLEHAASLYLDAARSGRLYAPPEPVRDVQKRFIRALPGGEVVDLSWPSGYRSACSSYDQWLALCPKTQRAHARWLRHERPRNALICLHGYGAGAFAFEEQAYQANWLYGLGVDVVFITLPFHARRAQRPWARPIFPTADPYCSNDGFAQAVYDVRALMGFLRDHGVARLAVTGMSLGGFTSSLLATVEPDLDAVIPIIPFASLPRIIWEHGEGTEARRLAEADGLSLELFEAAHAATTPLRRDPVISADRILLIGAERDQVTPLAHAIALRDHFSRELTSPRFHTLPGTHLVQSGRRSLFGTVARFLAARELISRRDRTSETSRRRRAVRLAWRPTLALSRAVVSRLPH